MSPLVEEAVDDPYEHSAWQEQLAEEATDEIDFSDRVLREGDRKGGLILELALDKLSASQLELHFVELMARDLDDYRAVDYAGRVLQEIAHRSPELGVALLSAMAPAEKELLVPSVAKGWTLSDPDGAFAWIEVAWIVEDGGYIDRALQNDLYTNAMGVLVGELRQYEQAAGVLAGLTDPELKAELTEQVAHRMVSDGPESALDRLAALDTGVFDSSVMDAVAEQWAARDGPGAADWVLENEAEMSPKGVRSIAKHLTLGAKEEALVGFHDGLGEARKRDTVASEVARLKARREPLASAEWARAIESPQSRQRAVMDALYEIGFEDFGSSVGYIDSVYELQDETRSPVVFSTLKGWLSVDVDAVAGYLGSGRANLSEGLSEELLLEMELLPQG
ncbi:hypothetical protein [Pelagicoccus sp. SDUM812002]|uniref:hypothetical protein n=1 Tax=Pelagicoccus sp. SDUM812002 TaxID=3041266 RepID=UPI00280CE25F|nr:hypothetical protein [Pelagicoccus sp. SDUM812002]MDQ8186511.1 hypothetical protein [Pelagicoccus sp. SDUM812002]